MNAMQVAQRVASVFDEDGIPYGIGGALALSVWGAPRATKDVDISAFVDSADLGRVLDSLERAGVMLRRDDAVRGAARIGLFQGRLGKTTVDVFVSAHPQYIDMARRSRRVADPTGQLMSFISAEDLVLHKLLFGRHKDIGDLEALLAVRPLDLAYVRAWLLKMAPAGDRRFALLDDLERRFGPPT